MRHPHDHALHSALTGHVDDGLERRDERFAAFQTESFLWRPLPLEKLLKPVNRWWCCCFTLWLRITPPPCPETPPAAALHACAVNYRCVEECEGTQTDLVDRIILARRVLFSSRLNCMTPGVSNFCLIHWHCSTSLMNINSTPMCWQ